MPTDSVYITQLYCITQQHTTNYIVHVKFKLFYHIVAYRIVYAESYFFNFPIEIYLILSYEDVH